MTIEVLIPTMEENDAAALLRRMNIQSNSIIVNQKNGQLGYQILTVESKPNGHKIIAKCYNMSERGVGLSRNTSLAGASAEIVLFADDDLCYHDQYDKLITRIFENDKTVDVALFNVPGVGDGRPDDLIEKEHTINYFNFMRYGTYRMAARLTSLRKNNIWFSLLFGGGAVFGSGEDTLFLAECLKKKLKLKAYPIEIAKIIPRPSSWFNGYNEKYFRDKGALFTALSEKYGRFLIYRYAYAKRGLYGGEVPMQKAIEWMLKGSAYWKQSRFFLS